MTFRAQRLANTYPIWTKLRSDPTSMGQRIFSVFSELTDLAGIESIKFTEEAILPRMAIGSGYLQQLVLTEAEHIKRSPGGDFAFPTVTGVVDGDSLQLDRVEFLEDLLRGPATRLTFGEDVEVADWVLFDSETESLASMPINYSARLCVFISGTTKYNHKEQNRDRLFSDQRFVSISGLDTYSKPFTEHITVLDDGVYYTRHAFSEVLDVDWNGFDGQVTVSIGGPRPTASGTYEPDLFRIAVLEDLEGPLKYRIMPEETYENEGITYLQLFTNLFKTGWQYRRGTVELDNEQLLSEVCLYDMNSQPYLARDIAMDPDNGFLWVLEASGRLLYYEPQLNVFNPPDSDITDKAYVISQPATHRAKVHERLQCFTYFLDPSVDVYGVTIKIVDPNNTVLYVQADGTLGASVYELQAQPRPLGVQDWTPSKTWLDKDFYLQLDSPGIWYIYTSARTANGTTKDYTAVSAEHWIASGEFDLNSQDLEVLFFNDNGKLVVGGQDVLTEITLHRDYYLADTTQQILWLAEEYDEVTVTNA